MGGSLPAREQETARILPATSPRGAGKIDQGGLPVIRYNLLYTLVTTGVGP
jgi:hypothetical protein